MPLHVLPRLSGIRQKCGSHGAAMEHIMVPCRGDAAEPNPCHEQRLAKDFICLADGAALRCSQLPASGGAYAKDQVVWRCGIPPGVFSNSCLRSADRKV